MLYIQILSRMHLAIGLAGVGQRQQLAAELRRVRELARNTCFRQFEHKASLVEAWDEISNGDRSRGRALLAAALGAARDARYEHVHIIRSARIFRELLAEACEAGIEVDYVTRLIRQYRVAAPEGARGSWPWPVKVHTLGRFEVHVDGAPLEFSGKAPRKPLALLKSIIAFGAVGVPAGALIDALWPEEEGDAARKSLDVTIARLRRLLGRGDALLVSDETVTLNPKLCWVDAQSFLGRADASDGETERACTLYAGTFLPGDLEAPWTVKYREKLRSRFVHLVEDVGADAEARSAWDDAIAWYRRGLEADELAETFHQGLMRCYRALGRHAEGMSAYRRLRQTLSVTLGIAPSEHSQALARTLQQDGATFRTQRGLSTEGRPAAPLLERSDELSGPNVSDV
jgi:DNA-binding SARP family transcriptional activator